MLKNIYTELVAIRKELQKINNQLKPFSTNVNPTAIFHQIQGLGTKHRM